MRKTRLFTILLLMLTLTCSIFVLASCGGDDNTPQKLTSPTVVLKEDIATWSADPSADKFEISVDGNLSYIENSVTSRKLADGQTFKIRAIGDGTNYTNSDWSNSVTYVKPIAKYTVIWKNGDTVLETDTGVTESTIPTYNGAEPTKAADAQYSYVFAGWTPEVVAANGDVTYTAVFTSVLNKYTVTWKNGDTTLETDENVAYGTVPTYNGTEPQKAADAQYVYVFSGWSPAVSEVVGNVTYVAQFTSETRTNSYTILWKNGDITLETDENVIYGSTPSYDGATPTKAATAQYTYTFNGWTPQISSVTGSVTYQAQFTETLRTYTVTFYSEDGLTVLDTVTVEYGSSATYSKSTPVKNATAGHTYVFEKWVTTQGGSVVDDLTNVIGDRSVFASFKDFVRTVTVYIVSNNTDYGTVSVSTLNNVPYGATITVNGNTVTINGQTVTANSNTATAQYTYTFANWTADATVGNDTIITANFSRSVNSYTVTWKNGDTVLETDENVAYGTTPVYNGNIPTKPSDAEYTYTFSGWTPSVSPVNGDVTYYANFTDATNKYTVTFYNDDATTVLGVAVVNYGETASYPNEFPTKTSTAQYSYAFDKWVTQNDSVTEAVLTNVTSNMNVYASYKATTKTYSVRIMTSNEAYGSVSTTVLNNIPYGTEIVLNGNNLTIGENTIVATANTSTPQYIYSFSSWTAADTITGDTLITANFTRSVNKYTVVWKNGEETLEKDENVEYGATPIYNGATPTKPSNAEYSYTFSGWSPSISPVTGDVTYYAQFTDATNKYTVTFYDDDGSTVLNVVAVDYGQKAEFSHSNPTKSSTAQYSYTFNKWVSAKGGNIEANLISVTSNVCVYASYTSSVRTYTVQITTNNINFGTVSKTVLNDIPYGTEILVRENIVTINGQVVTATPKNANAQYTYTFANWTADGTVGNDTTITANFSSSVNTYTVIWKNGDTVLETDENVAYGATPIYNGENPTKEADKNIYTFSGWSPVISSVTGNVTYVAQFTTTANKHTVVFYDDDGVTELGRVVVGHGETAIYPNALPTKESTAEITYIFEKWVTAKDGATEATLTNISENKSVYAKYIATVRTYIVTFCDWDGSVLDEQTIEYGQSATPPQEPYREGYRFDKWNSAYNNITEDLQITATYIRQFTVKFVDYDNSIIDLQLVDYGSDATKPNDPIRKNYSFIGWNTTFTNVVADLTVKAQYIRQYTVTFVDYDGTVISTDVVNSGDNATPPSNPVRVGYAFTSWNQSYNNVVSDMEIMAVYEINRYTVTFLDVDGSVIASITSVAHGTTVTPPETPDMYFDWSKTKAYRFTGWKDWNANQPIVGNIFITAEYSDEITDPIIAIETKEISKGTTTSEVSVYLCGSFENIYGMSLKLQYAEELVLSNGSVIINSKLVGSESTLNTENSLYELSWADGQGIDVSERLEVLTLTFSVDKYTNVGEYIMELLDGTYIIGENLSKITPIVIVGHVVITE